MKFSAPLFILPLLSLVPLPSLGEDEQPWYQVEVIAFSQQDLYRDEKHRTDLKLEYPTNWTILQGSAIEQTHGAAPLPESDGAANTIATTDTVTPETSEPPFVLLGKDQFALGPDDYALSRAPGYRVLLHWAWRQPGLNIDESPWVLVAGGEQYGKHHELEGSIRLVLNRYLHFQANLWRSRFGTPVAPAAIEPSIANDTLVADTNETVDAWPALPEQPWSTQQNTIEGSPEDQAPINAPAWDYQFPEYALDDLVVLNQSTRLQLNEMTYLDHPDMGVLIYVSRYQPEEE